MTHARQQIREAAAALLTGLTTTGTRVHQSRLPYVSLGDAELPALLVVTNDESVEPHTIGSGLERRLTLTVSGLAKTGTNLDDTLDTIAAEVETAIGAARTLGGKCTDIRLTSLRVGIDTSLETDVGRVDLEYEVLYFTNAGAPGTLI